jgi:enduracididine biosynthesis enzyme MppQ
MCDLSPGYLEPSLLPVALLRDAYPRALEEFGAAALSYGYNSGALPLREALAEAAPAADGHSCGPDNIVITSGTSQTLYLLATYFGARGDVVLVDEACYDFGRQIFVDCGLSAVRVPADRSGMDPAALARALTAISERIAFIYLNPTFHNPTGLVVPLDRRRELLAVAERHGALIVEDDAYAELNLAEGTRPPPSLAALAGYRGVVRLCSFSKTLGPGLRLGWLLAAPALAERIASHAVFVSGGCLNHATSLAVTMLLTGGEYQAHLHGLRARLRERRDVLVDELRAALPADIDFATPAGGFFLWLTFDRSGSADSATLLGSASSTTLLGSASSTTLLGSASSATLLGSAEEDLVAAATRAGVRVAAGSRFGSGARPAIRLAYSFNSPGDLRIAARRLAAAWKGQPR